MTEPKNDGCGAIRAMQHELSQRRKILVSRGLADLSRPQEFAVGKPNEQGDILEAARSGNFARVKTILALRPSDVAMRGRYNLTPLHLAAENGHFNVVKLLLDYGAEIDAKGNIGQTPLLSAAEGGYAEVADILIAGGADITAETTSQRSILYAAAGGGLLKLVQAIAAKGIDVNTPWYGSLKRTAIHQAAENGRADVVRFLLAEGGQRAQFDRLRLDSIVLRSKQRSP
jgi:ankyrin repeat protein